MDLPEIVAHCSGFEWDKDNLTKNWEKHQVAFWECEEIFFNQPFLMAGDEIHSDTETRYFALGKTDGGRRLFAAFTIRDRHIRIISVRDMNRKEKLEYQNGEEKNTYL